MAAPLTSREFSALMAVLGPFEKSPKVAVGVSGGSDSLALALLAHGWAAGRKGHAVALTVDHNLRPGSADEARQTGKWLESKKMPHHTLVWQGDVPRANIQAKARAARYQLMARWCRDHGVDHLLVAHHLEDQAETFLLRLARGSGVDGLAAMARVTQMEPQMGGLRLLRPFLGVSQARLRATLEKRGQDWIADPSNEDRSYARVRMRKLLPALAAEGIDPARLAATASHMSRARAALEDWVADFLGEAAVFHDEGYLWLDHAALGRISHEVGLRALSQILIHISGNIYPPRFKNLEALYLALQKNSSGSARGSDSGKGWTLHGCRLLLRSAPWLGKGEKRLLICREACAATQTLSLSPGDKVLWDGRFLIERQKRISPRGRPKDGLGVKVTLKCLSRAGWTQVLAMAPQLKNNAPPYPVLASLAALWEKDRLVAVPHLNYWAGKAIKAAKGRNPARANYRLARLDFSPQNSPFLKALTVA